MRFSASGSVPGGSPPTIRPSLLDPGLQGDPWMASCTNPEFLVLYHHNHPVAVQTGTPLEQSSLNSWIFRFRSRQPRRKTLLAG